MTIILPESDNIVTGSAPTQPGSGALPGGIGVRDFGESLVQPIDPVRQAAEFCLVDCSLHDATRAFDAFTQELATADSDFDSWPQRFTAEAKRVRDQFAHRIPDGPSRDRFDTGFDVFAKAKAVETRGLATHRRIATNRAELDRALSGYSESISRAMNPVSVDFALSQGETAIRNQVAAQVLSADEGEALSRRYRADIAARRARQFTDDDPAAAAAELKKETGGLFADLDPAERRALAGHADRVAAARQQDIARAQKSEEQRQGAQSALRREAFLRDLEDRARNGAASLADIAAAARDGILDPDEADTRMRTLESDLAGREKTVQHVAGLMGRPGAFLNPGNAEDRRAAEIHWKDMVQPLTTDLVPDKRAALEDSVVAGTGIVPKPLRDELRGGLLSGDPALRVASARRVHRWLMSQPPIPVDENGLRIPEFETVRPYLDLPVSDSRIVELAEDAVMRLKPGEVPPRPEPLGKATGEARIEPLNPESGTADEAQSPGQPGPHAGSGPASPEGARDRLEERLADPETRDALREQLLKDLETEAEKSGLSPAEVLERKQEIREALPADPAKGVQVALVPLIAAGGGVATRMLLSPGALSSALTAIGLGGFLGSEPGDLLPPGQSNEIPDRNATGDGISRRDEDDGGGGRGRGRSGDGLPEGGASGDPDEDPPEDNRRGRKARDSSKNERHGDDGRALGKAEKRFKDLEERIRNAPNRKTRNRLRKTRQKIKENAQKKDSGTEDSRGKKKT